MTNAGFPFLAHTSLFVNQAEGYAQGPIFVFDGSQQLAGTDQLTGSTAPPPPQDLPVSGQVAYDRLGNGSSTRSSAYQPDRVYVLQRESQPAGSTGTTGTTAA